MQHRRIFQGESHDFTLLIDEIKPKEAKLPLYLRILLKVFGFKKDKKGAKA